MKKEGFILLVCLIVATVNLPLHFATYKVFYVQPFLAQYPPDLRPYIDVDPFPQTWYWKSAIVVWISTASIIAVILAKKLKHKLRLLTVSALVYIISILPFFSPTLKATIIETCIGDPIVDVLLIGDEEFMANPERVQNAERVLREVQDKRFAPYQIYFEIWGWLSWDSEDTETLCYQLMQEALIESGLPKKWIRIIGDLYGWGFISGSPWKPHPSSDYVFIDLLIIFTGQNMDIKGFSPPMLNMTIVRYDSVNLHVLTHELGHQYYLNHCSDPWCVMNDFWQWGNDWCSSCRSKLNNNKGKWLTDPSLMVGCWCEDDPTENPCLVVYTFDGLRIDKVNQYCPWGNGHGIHARYGATVNVNIKPYRGYYIEKVVLRNLPFIYTYDPNNPPKLIERNLGAVSEFSFVNDGTWAAYYVIFRKHDKPGGGLGEMRIAIL